MSGIVFFRTRLLSRLREFYVGQLDCGIWLDQGDCVILQHGNLLLGFCERDMVATEQQGLITFFYATRAEVDRVHDILKTTARAAPEYNEKYRIYQFFADDPEGRLLEFQSFEHTVSGFLTARESLLDRRSVRYYRDEPVPETVLRQLWELCRYAPTARNSQSYYLKPVVDRGMLDKIAALRPGSSEPIARAPMAVAIVADPSLSSGYVQDGCIAAYHFLLAAYSLGLGTCWMGGLDKPEVKRLLDIPEDHFVATVTPLGYPAESPSAPERKPASWFLR